VKKVGEKNSAGIHLVLNTESPSWMLVNDDGLEILKLCDSQRSHEAISEIISETHNLKREDASRVVESFIQQAQKNRVLSGEEQPEPVASVFSGIALEITQRCNLRCIHCYLSAGDETPDELSLDEIKSLIDSIKELGGTSLAIGGGEPLLRDDIYKILDYASSKDLMLSLGTNGILINQETARKLAKYPLKIQVSLDGARAETNDRIRGAGSYAKTLIGIDNLIEQGLAKDVIISYTAMSLNLKEIPEIVEFAIEKNIPVIQFPPLSPSGRAKENWDVISMSDEQVLWFWRYISKRSQELKGQMDLLADCFSINIEKSGVPYRCSIGSQLRVDPRGDTYPCQCFHSGEEYILGNIRELDLKSIVHGSKLSQIISSCYSRPSDITKCDECGWKNYCGSGCMGVAYERYGDALQPDSCEIRKTWIEELLQKKINDILDNNPASSESQRQL